MHAEDLDNVTSLPSTPAHGPAQGLATVVGEHPEGGFWLDDGRERVVARRAASCLLEPAAGDRVWVVGASAQARYVIAVLERGTEAPAVLSVPGDAILRAAGTLTVAGDQGLQLTSPHGMGVSADELSVHARQGRAAFTELSVVARSVFASLARVTRVGRVLELLVDRVVQRSTHSVRSIEGIDQTRAGTIEYRADGEAQIQATHALVNGKDLVKMDGGQIHLG